MALSNVALTDTFEVWRTRTNQLVVLTNDVDASPALYFTSNSSPLTLSADALRKGNVYFQLSTSSDVSNTQTTTLATSKAVNDTYLTTGAAFTKANAANVLAFVGNETAVAAYTKANTMGTIATQNTNNVAITGGNVSGVTIVNITDLAVADGGTGASDAAGARGQLGVGNVGTMNTATQVLDNVSTTRGTVLYRGASNWLALSPGTSGNVLVTGGAGADPSWVRNSGGVPDVIIEDQKSSGTNGGSASEDVWTTRTLNTLYRNQGSLATLSSNQFTLPPGTYYITAKSPFYYLGGTARIRLYNVTDSSVERLGYNGQMSGGTSPDRPDTTYLTLDAIVTITGTKAFRIEYYVDNFARTTTENLGFATGLGTELYTNVSIWRLPG